MAASPPVAPLPALPLPAETSPAQWEVSSNRPQAPAAMLMSGLQTAAAVARGEQVVTTCSKLASAYLGVGGGGHVPPLCVLYKSSMHHNNGTGHMDTDLLETMSLPKPELKSRFLSQILLFYKKISIELTLSAIPLPATC